MRCCRAAGVGVAAAQGGDRRPCRVEREAEALQPLESCARTGRRQALVGLATAAISKTATSDA